MNGIENFLPPHWITDNCEEEIYINTVTGEKTTEHPFSRYINLTRSIERSNNEQERTEEFSQIAIEDFKPLEGITGTIQERRETNFDYHCQWSERDATGKVNNFGLTIRYVNHEKIMIKFDG